MALNTAATERETTAYAHDEPSASMPAILQRTQHI
jgi:hypothetical protein